MKQKNLILMVVAVGCGLVAAFLTTQINARPRVEQVEVIVASKDLAVGTMMTKADLPKLITRKKISKDALPAAFVLNEDELLDRRLTRPVLKDETFNPGILTKGGVITLPEGMDMVSMPVSVSTAVAGFVGPGSKVDVLATLRLNDQYGSQLRAFPLLVDMLVLAVDQHVSYDTAKGGSGVFPNMSNVSFAATQEQALLLALAQQRGCHLQLLLRHPGKPLDKSYDIKEIKKLLENVRNSAEIRKTEDGQEPGSETPVPAENLPPKAEVVKVWMAKAHIEAGTEITKELVAQKLVETEIPKVAAKGAYSDLTELINKNLTLKTGLSEGQWVTSSLVGPPTSKPNPLEEFTPPKANPMTPKLPAGPRAIRDVTVTGPNGTFIYRYEEIRPNEWRLKAILTPQEAARPSLPPPPAPKPEEPRPDKDVD